MNPDFVGEHLLPGRLGNLFIIFSFCLAILATVSFWMATTRKDQEAGWRAIGRWSFRIHTAAVIGMMTTILVMLFNHYYEYLYVFNHSSNEMPLRYVFSSFWEGEEGSFLLWIFWQSILGHLLIHTAKKWEAPVMTIFSSAQVLLTSMLLGIYIFDIKIGSNPFALLREDLDFYSLAVFRNPNYLADLDGNGLNELLQNYWMTIHPPTLFLGFASTLIPFCFAIAGLWQNQLREWIKPALPWTYFSIGILGLGILMGGAWAYEALSFGGFWAWDPVENASMVPWLTMVGGAHLMLIHKNRGSSLYMALFLIMISYILILYSSFLTKSGILGESSVHSFTDMGMGKHLLFFFLFYAWLMCYMLMVGPKIRKVFAWFSLALFVLYLLVFAGVLPVLQMSHLLMVFAIGTGWWLFKGYQKHFPKQKQDEDLWSREFWMFVGALTLLVSAFQISAYTSIPVFNKLTPALDWLWTPLNNMFPSENLDKLINGDIAAVDEPARYNAWQEPFAIVIATIMAFSQFLKYKKTDVKTLVNKLTLSMVITVVMTALIVYYFQMKEIFHILLLVASVFLIAGNADYLFRVMKGKIPKAGASIAHIGMGLLLLGALISTSQSEVISKNVLDVSISQLSEEITDETDILLKKNDTLPMGNYLVSYRGHELNGKKYNFYIDYFKNTDAGPEFAFSLSPFAQKNKSGDFIADPGTKHYWDHDVFTHTKFMSVNENPDDKYRDPEIREMAVGDTLQMRGYSLILKDLINLDSAAQQKLNSLNSGLITRVAKIEMVSPMIPGPAQVLRPIYIADASQEINMGEPDTLNVIESVISIDGLVQGRDDAAYISIKEPLTDEYIVMHAIVFPWINILWLGCILMVVGTFIAVWARIRRQMKSS